MAEYLIQSETLSGIADKIRPLLGLTGTMTPEQMQTNLTTEQANIAAALAALTEKGVEVPEGSNSGALAGLIAAIEAGGGKIEKGVYIPAEDVALPSSGTSFHKIELNLSFDPMVFCIFFSYPGNTNIPQKLNFAVVINQGYRESGGLGSFRGFSCGTDYGTSLVMNSWGASTSSDWRTYLSSTVACVPPHMLSGAIIPAGKIYYWMAFGEEGEGSST